MARWTDNKNYELQEIVSERTEEDILDYLALFGENRLPVARPAFDPWPIYRGIFQANRNIDKVRRYKFLRELGLPVVKHEGYNFLLDIVEGFGRQPTESDVDEAKRLIRALQSDGFVLYGGGQTRFRHEGGVVSDILDFFCNDIDFLDELRKSKVRLMPKDAFERENVWKHIIDRDQVQLARYLIKARYAIKLDPMRVNGFTRVRSAAMLRVLLENGVEIISVNGNCSKEVLLEAAKSGIEPTPEVFNKPDIDVYRAFLEAGYPASQINISIARSAGCDDIVAMLSEYGVDSGDFTVDLVASIEGEETKEFPLLEKALCGEVDVDWPQVIEAMVNRTFRMRGKRYRVPGTLDWARVSPLYEDNSDLLDTFYKAVGKLEGGLGFEYLYPMRRGFSQQYDAELIQLLASRGARISIRDDDPRFAVLYCDEKTADAILDALGVSRDDLDFEGLKKPNWRNEEETATDYLFDSDNLDAYAWLKVNWPSIIPAASAAFGKTCKVAEHEDGTWGWNIGKLILESCGDGAFKDGRSAATNAHIICSKGNEEMAELYGRKIQLSDAQAKKLEADVRKKIEKACNRIPSHRYRDEALATQFARLEKMLAAIDSQRQGDNREGGSRTTAKAKKPTLTEATEMAKAAIGRKEPNALSVLAPFKGKIKVAKGTDLAMRIAAYGTPAQLSEFCDLAGQEWDKRKALCVAIRNGNTAVAEGLIARNAKIWHVEDERFETRDDLGDPYRYFRNAIYKGCYNEIEHFFEAPVLAGDEEEHGECIDVAAARSALKSLFDKGLLDWRETERFAITIFTQESEDSELFEMGKLLYEHYLDESQGWITDPEGNSCRRDSYWQNYSLIEVLGHEYTSRVAEDYIFSVIDDECISSRFKQKKNVILKTPASLKKFIPHLRGDEIKTKTNMMKTLAAAGYLDELEMMRGWPDAFTKKNIEGALEASVDAGQVETQAYLLEVIHEMFDDESGLEL